MKHWQWLLVAFFTLCLIGVRYGEDQLFYDPFLPYFKGNGQYFPNFEWGKLIVNHIFRFLLNLGFSLGIIHFIFLNKKWTLQAGIIIGFSFLIFFPAYLYFIYTEFSFGEMISFYLRRMVIQPVLMLILVPVFYYLKSKNLSED